MNRIGFALLTLASATIASAQTVLVPRGTDVPLMFVDRVTSNGAHEGQMVDLKVSKHVFVNGRAVVSGGTITNERPGTPIRGPGYKLRTN